MASSDFDQHGVAELRADNRALESEIAKLKSALKAGDERMAAALAEIHRLRGMVGNEKFAYVQTPKVGTVAHVVDGERLLVVRRADSGKWYVPTGWCDRGERPAEGAAREVTEETGLNVEVVDFLGVENVAPVGTSVEHSYRLHFACRVVGGEFRLNPQEASEYRWVDETEIAEFDNLIGRGRIWVELAFKYINGCHVEPFFDPQTPPALRLQIAEVTQGPGHDL